MVVVLEERKKREGAEEARSLFTGGTKGASAFSSAIVGGKKGAKTPMSAPSR